MTFESAYVRFMWTDTLSDVDVFYAKDIEELKHNVEFKNEDKYGKVVFSFEKSDPFKPANDDSGRHYKFVYFDPYYQLKRAWEKNETIQCSDSEGVWHDISNPEWNIDPSRYRVKPKIGVTNREFSRWLAEGNGEYFIKGSGALHTTWDYLSSEENEEPNFNIFVRRWDSDLWFPLTRKYLFGE